MSYHILKKIITTACVLSVLGGCSRISTMESGAGPKEPLEIWVWADIHYLASSLHDDGTVFRQLVEPRNTRKRSQMNSSGCVWNGIPMRW